MAFKLLKRGNKGKMEAQEVVVPASTSLAAQVNRNEEASREESSIIKARVRERTTSHESGVLLLSALGGVILSVGLCWFVRLTVRVVVELCRQCADNRVPSLSFVFVTLSCRPSNRLMYSRLARRLDYFPAATWHAVYRALCTSLLQVLAYEANIEAAVLAQDAGTTPLPEDYTQFIPKVRRW